MIDRDLSEMYGVENRALNLAVRINPERFPEDFMFQLNEQEWNSMSSQFVMTSKSIVQVALAQLENNILLSFRICP